MTEFAIPELTGKVLACIDDSCYAEAVCDFAAWSAQRMQAPLSLIHVLDRDEAAGNPQNLSGRLSMDAQENLLHQLAELDAQRARLAMEHGKLMLNAALQRVNNKGAEHVEVRQRHGELVDTLVELQPETRMLVMGKRGADRHSAHGHLGSHLESTIRAVRKPILIAQQSFTPPRQVMVCYDGSLTMQKGIRIVAASPVGRGIPHHLVMVGAETEASRAQLEDGRQILVQAGFEVSARIIPGEADVALTDYQTQENIDLVVMGAYGHSRIRQLILGSTTTSMIKKTRVSLLVLR
jgi:nucleotide-binding universal stress UspA family protein